MHNINGYDCLVIKTLARNRWGIETDFINDIPIYITDLERTLLDGLSKPQYCLGIREILHAFELAKNKIDMEKIYSYVVERGTIALIKRLGFVLQKIGVCHVIIDKLQSFPTTVYQKLDVLGKRQGKYHKEWMIIENI